LPLDSLQPFSESLQENKPGKPGKRQSIGGDELLGLIAAILVMGDDFVVFLVGHGRVSTQRGTYDK
jgi:hypothetical protein